MTQRHPKTITIETAVTGKIWTYDGAGPPEIETCVAPPGTYEIDDLDSDWLFITLTTGEEITVELGVLGYTECADCGGQGDFTYREYPEGDFESDWCDACDGMGWIKP